MSRFITDEELEAFATQALHGEGNVKAAQLLEAIKANKEYEARAECACPVNYCTCYFPIELDPNKIQAGDAFKQILPDGRELTLGAIGVRHREGGVMEIATAGWPAAIVRIPDHGRVELVRKGQGINKHELKHRREKIGGAWEDGL